MPPQKPRSHHPPNFIDMKYQIERRGGRGVVNLPTLRNKVYPELPSQILKHITTFLFHSTNRWKTVPKNLPETQQQHFQQN
jgi:hypothetical protein